MKKVNQFGVWLSDKIAEFGGSWTFLIAFTSCLIVWLVFNLVSVKRFDPYPFILLNLLFSALAGYQAPIIMMANNRQAIKDRKQAEEDLLIDMDTNKRIRLLEKEIFAIRDMLEKK